MECRRLQSYVAQLEGQLVQQVGTADDMVDSGIDAQHSSQQLVGDCILAQCVAERKRLTEQNSALTEQLGEQTTLLTEMQVHCTSNKGFLTVFCTEGK